MRLDLIQERLRTLGLSQKEVAGKIFDSLDNDSQRALTTLESKLSKLLSGSAEGRKAFTPTGMQAALAAGLAVPVSQLAEWFTGEAILFDPALSRDLVATVRQQALTANIEFVEVKAPPGTTARDALRAAADEREDAIVALATDADAAFYEGRGRRFSVLTQGLSFGAKLSRYPDLLPVLPAEPAIAWDDRRERGMPLLVHADLEAVIERGAVELLDGDQLRSLQARLTECRSINQTPSFSLTAVLPWLEQKSGTRISLFVGDGWNRALRVGVQKVDADPASGDTQETTEAWIHKRRIYLRGAGAERLKPWLQPHDVVIADPAINAFREALRTCNPFSDARFEQLIAEGVNVGLDLRPWLQRHVEQLSAEPSDVSVPAFSDVLESSARTVLREISGRPWRIRGIRAQSAWASEADPRPTVPLWLQRAVRSPLLVLEPDAFCQLRVIASLGAGRVLHIRLSRFSGTTPTPLTLEPGSLQVDGGDVHLWLRPDYDEMLEAESLVPRRRREEAAGADSSDDDD